MSELLDALGKAVSGFSGNPFDVLKGLKPLPAHRWDPVSVDGKHIGKVDAHDLGLEIPTVWTYWQWKADADSKEHKLKIVAKQGTADVTVLLDDVEVDTKGRLQVRPIVQGFTAKISVRIHFVLDGKATEYRFDGQSAP